MLYEGLPRFFYLCDRLGHLLRVCDDKQEEEFELSFGNWIRASIGARDKKAPSHLGHSPYSSESPSVPSQEANDEFVEPMEIFMTNTKPL